MQLTTREKVLLTILLGVLCSWLFGCGSGITEHYVPLPEPATADGNTDAAYLQHVYAAYNEAYFHGHLPSVVRIDMDEPNQSYMASTFCDESGCVIHFNEKLVAAPRVGNLIMLHEQCHVKTWMQDMDSFGKQIEHGRIWRSCMLQLDMQGAFREQLIDNYFEVGQ